ncbi:MAG: hypothetical protein ACYTF1_11250 [Planctomycetota bacterium]|jgi:hypothetical protein
MDFVTVGDARNTTDTRYYATGFGMVAYEYTICKYEVTDGQPREFLNVVDPTGTNPHGIYKSDTGGSRPSRLRCSEPRV